VARARHARGGGRYPSFVQAERSFRYWRDPVCLVSIGIYLLNRFVVKPATGHPSDFWHCYLNDVLCLPIWVPVALWVQRKLSIRKHDLPPTQGELALHWFVWSWLFECLGPAIRRGGLGAVADPWDVVAYAVGAVAAGALWRSARDPSKAGAVGRPNLARHAAAIFAICLTMLAVGVWQTLAHPLDPAQVHLSEVADSAGEALRRDLDISLRIMFLLANAITVGWLVQRSFARPRFRILTKADVPLFLLQLTVAVVLGSEILASDRSAIGVH